MSLLAHVNGDNKVQRSIYRSQIRYSFPGEVSVPLKLVDSLDDHGLRACGEPLIECKRMADQEYFGRQSIRSIHMVMLMFGFCDCGLDFLTCLRGLQPAEQRRE